MITPRLALRGYLAVMILLVLVAGFAIAQAPKAAGTRRSGLRHVLRGATPTCREFGVIQPSRPSNDPRSLERKSFSLRTKRPNWKSEQFKVALIPLPQRATRVLIINSGSNGEIRSYLPSAHRS